MLLNFISNSLETASIKEFFYLTKNFCLGGETIEKAKKTVKGRTLESI